jgi:hypothetical protein
MKPEFDRLREAYLNMAQRANYRPAAPSDGCGGIFLTKRELGDLDRLAREADDYAQNFLKEEDTRRFWIGCADFAANRALVYTVEAARLLCAGKPARPFALTLLEMAKAEIEAVEG